MEVLRTENLCYKYEGAPGPFVLNDISLNIEKGEVVCIYGPNGSGKTTLLNTLCGLYKPSSGKVLLEGKDILGIDEKERFSKIGIVFQNPDDQLFSANVFQDIAFGPMNLGLQEDKVRERVDESLEIIGMTENRDSPVHTLSYGQKQKVAIAGVLAMRPEIILLDEPTSPLDPDSETRLLDFLKKLNEEEKLTIVLTTFNLNRLAGFVDKLVFLDTGRVKASSAPADFFKDRNVLNNKNFSPPVVVELFWKMMDLKIIQGDGNKIPLTIGQLIDNLKERCNN